MLLHMVTRSSASGRLRSGKRRSVPVEPPRRGPVRPASKRAKQALPRIAKHVISLATVCEAANNKEEWIMGCHHASQRQRSSCPSDDSSHNGELNGALHDKVLSILESADERSDGVSDESSRPSTPSCGEYEMPFNFTPERRGWRLVCTEPPCCRAAGQQIKCKVCGNVACSNCGLAFRMHYDDAPCKCHHEWCKWL